MLVSNNLLSTKITDKIWVSTAMLARKELPWGEYFLIETWIFSDDPKQQNTQIVHRNKKEAFKVHKYVSKNLLKKLKIAQ